MKLAFGFYDGCRVMGVFLPHNFTFKESRVEASEDSQLIPTTKRAPVCVVVYGGKKKWDRVNIFILEHHASQHIMKNS